MFFFFFFFSEVKYSKNFTSLRAVLLNVSHAVICAIAEFNVAIGNLAHICNDEIFGI